MPNNPAEDRYNPPSASQTDFEKTQFSEVNERDLFWLNTTTSDNNHAFRKMNENQGLDTKTQETTDFKPRTEVYYKL